MAKLTLTPQDAGKAIPLTGGIHWEVLGTANLDTFEVAAGTSAFINSGAGEDVVRFLGNASDYSVRLSGTEAIFTHTATGKAVSVPMNREGDQVQFGAAGELLNLKIDTTAGVSFRLGDQTLTAEDAPIDASGGGTQILDGKGTNLAAFTIDASTAAIQFSDNVQTANNVRILGFGADDGILIQGAASADYDTAISSNATGDVTIEYNQNGVGNTIELVGVAAGGFAFDVASFNALAVGDLTFA